MALSFFVICSCPTHLSLCNRILFHCMPLLLKGCQNEKMIKEVALLGLDKCSYDAQTIVKVINVLMDEAVFGEVSQCQVHLTIYEWGVFQDTLLYQQHERCLKYYI